jgi:hypothetical protein
MLWVLLAVGCGGRTTSTSDAGSQLVEDASIEALPQPGTPACDMAGVCILCSDGWYHCGGGWIAPPCPSGIMNGDPCQKYASPGPDNSDGRCYEPCADDGGTMWGCALGQTWAGNGCP